MREIRREGVTEPVTDVELLILDPLGVVDVGVPALGAADGKPVSGDGGGALQQEAGK